MEKKKILLIDDEKDICTLTKLNLEASGPYEVTLAYSGEEGLEKFEKENFDLVITDYKMPGMDGKEVLDRIKASHSKSPVVIFSIYHDDDSRVTQEIKSTADGIISKPIRVEQLHQVIQSTLK
jgi:CheY-like chemotaxis protein